jgi:hypothetical protein
MKYITQVYLYISLVGFIGIQFATVLDDPQHLVEPDPDCPICVAAKTEVYVNPHISISFTPDIILFLVEDTLLDQGIENYFSILSIRAPPLCSLSSI